MISLYQDQQLIVDDVRTAMRRNRRVLLVSPTGSGKTVMFSYIAARTAERNKRITILVHRDELVGQVSRTLTEFGVNHGIIAAGYPSTDYHVHVASVFSLVRRINRLPIPDLIICDEAHHCTTGNTWGKITSAWQSALLLGVTATPCRTDGQGLGDTFGELVHGPSMSELISTGRLSPYRIFAPSSPDLAGVHRRAGDYAKDQLAASVDKPSITGDSVKYYRRLLNGAPAVAFCVSVEHAQHVAEQFSAAGYVSVSVDGTMERDDRRQVMADFASGRINVLASCDLISEGFDVPGIMGAILLRPTQSFGLYMQQVGRSLRFIEGKTAIILDHAGNAMRHGLPDDVREWSLTGTAAKRSSTDDEDIAIRQCKQCFRILRATVTICPDCGYEFPAKPRVIAQVSGELSEIDLSKRIARIEQGRAQSVEQLVAMGYNRYRAMAIVKAREAKQQLIEDCKHAGIPAWQLKGLKPKELRARLAEKT